MPSYPNHHFATLWEKVKTRYYTETNEILNIVERSSFITYLRNFPEINKTLPAQKGKGSQEGHAIYIAVLDIGKPTEINLSEKFYNALKLYGEGEPINKENDYNKYLQEFFITKNNLGEANLSLKDIYIEPRIVGETGNYYTDKLLIHITLGWLNNEKKLSEIYNNILLILGNPGEGKTSFCYRLLFEIAGKSKRPIYFCKLRFITNIEEFYRDPFQTIYNHLLSYGYNLKDGSTREIPVSIDSFKKSILILDGFDELEKIHNIDKDKFYLQLTDLTKTLFRPYKTVITSRKEVDTYRLLKKEIRFYYISELSVEEQNKWINNYNKKAKDPYIISYENLVEFNKPSHAISPLMRQPILLHIIAQLKLLPDVSYNASKIYDELFSRLIKRYWSNFNIHEDSHPVLNTRISNPTQLRSILQEIALEMFKRNSSHLNHESIPENIIRELGLTKNNEIEAIKILAIAFYFNYKINEIDSKRFFAVEFLHKTFGEYLAAEAIWNNIKRIYLKTSLSESEILLSVVKLFGNKIMLPNQIGKYLQEIIINEREHGNTITQEQSYLKDKIEYHLQYMFKYNFSFFLNNDENKIEKAVNVFYGIISLYMRIGGTMWNTYVNWGDDFNNLFRILAILNNKIDLDYFNFTKYDISRITFRDSSMNQTTFIDANLSYTSIQSGSFFQSKFVRAKLINANLSGSYFYKADFTDANLTNAFLDFSSLTKANFSNAILDRVDFRQSILAGANFTHAKLRSSNLPSVNLINSCLVNADLTGANLMSASFMHTDLTCANLTNADLTGARIFNAKLKCACLINVNLVRADFSGSDLSDAILINTDLSSTRGLSFEVLCTLKSLYRCKGIEKNILTRLANEYPHLFDEPTDPVIRRIIFAKNYSAL